jgi:hypothetical protein
MGGAVAQGVSLSGAMQDVDSDKSPARTRLVP